jgi:pantetheine-phosphate adenylyltransferase
MGRHHTGIYPGTFDPVTNGHMDIIQRAIRVVDHLVIGVARNAGKGPLFSLEERIDMVGEEVRTLGDVASRIEIRPFEGLLVEFAAEAGAEVLLRGLRAVSDF